MDASSHSRVTAGCVAVCTTKACEECAPSESLVVGRKKALLIGICGSKTASKDYSVLRGSHNDVFSVRDLLIDCYGYTADNITILIDDGVPGHVQPTRVNILEAIETLVKDAKAGDYFCFHYSGHSTRVKNRSNSEENGMDECIIPCDGEAKMIVGNELNAALVAPLPTGSYLVAVLDTCHSGSLLDLKHSWCNRVIVPWIPRGKRNSEEIRHRVVRRDACIFEPPSNTLSSISTPGRKVDFGGPGGAGGPPYRKSATRLLTRQNGINMNLVCPAPVPSTGSGSPATAVHRASTVHTRIFTYRSRTVSFASASGSREKPPAMPAQVATPTGAAQSDVHSALPGKFWVFSEEVQRCESPVSMVECNGWCRDREHDSERNDTDTEKPDVVRADVVSLASCQDSEITWEDEDGKSMTAPLVEILRCDPHQSLKDVLVLISHAMYTNAHIRHTKARAYKNRHKQLVANITENISKMQHTMSLVHPDLPPTIAVSPTFPVPRKPSFVARRMDDVKRLKQLLIEFSEREECDLDSVQNPELTSARPLDMNRQWKM